jgi:hypothetical protein
MSASVRFLPFSATHLVKFLPPGKVILFLPAPPILKCLPESTAARVLFLPMPQSFNKKSLSGIYERSYLDQENKRATADKAYVFSLYEPTSVVEKFTLHINEGAQEFRVSPGFVRNLSMDKAMLFLKAGMDFHGEISEAAVNKGLTNFLEEYFGKFQVNQIVSRSLTRDIARKILSSSSGKATASSDVGLDC